MKYLIQLLDKTIVSFTSFICSLHPMGYSLILLLLILSSCTDKENTNQESTTQDMLIVFEDSEKLQTDTKPLIASYEIRPELFFIQDNRVSVDIDGAKYGALYYEPISNLYFIADMVEVDITTIDTNNLYTNHNIERKYLLNTPVNPNAFFMYAGDLSITQRLYTNENSTEKTNYTYIKTLTPLKNSNTYLSNFEYPYLPDFEPEPRYKLDPIPIPITNEFSGGYEYYFTNQQEAFFLDGYSDFIILEGFFNRYFKKDL